MSLYTVTVDRPNSQNQGVNSLALIIPEFTGMVEGTIQRLSVTDPFVNVRTVRGTATLTNFGVGEASLQAVVAGEVADGTPVDVSKVNVTVDTLILARNAFPLLDTFQTQFDIRAEVAREQGKKIAKFKDEAFLIQATKASLLTASPYGSDGHQGGTKITLGSGTDNADPAKMYTALANCLEGMCDKDVDPVGDDLAIFLSPKEYFALIQAEQIVNGTYLTSDGTSVSGMIFKAFGVPVITTKNIPRTNITAHLLSNSGNSNAYNGDFTKLVATIFSARALLAGETISLTSDVFYDKLSKSHFVDSHLAFAATPNRPEFAGSIWKP